MNWEALTALGTIFSGLVIAATVVVAARQVRLTRTQLDHLRRATQLEGAMVVFGDLSEPSLLEARRFVRNELRERMKNETFRAEVSDLGGADDSVHREMIVLRMFERIGTYVKHGLLDGPIIYDLALPFILTSWDQLSEVVAIHRREAGAGLWENFQFLYEDGRRWQQTREAGYLKT